MPPKWMSIPALVVSEKAATMDKVLKPEDIVAILKNVRE